ncbi:QueT transporter family protein [Clostridium sp.]|uniref:QueT transporter family protein n=1 Tax=Clostridium sp. TaxID=1506 RepID=UPI003F369A3D
MRNNTKKIVVIALIAGLYAALTLALGFISYGPIQFRIAEVMTLLPLLGKEYIVALTLGCFLANVIGPYGVPDIIFGTVATFISVYLVYLTGKNMKDKKGYVLIASLWPTIVNAIVIGAMLNIFFGLPLVLSMLQVGFGQFVVITIIGVPLFNGFKEKYLNKLKDVMK